MKTLTTLSLICLWLSSAFSAPVESGSLRGSVSNRQTHLPVPGASVVVIGTSLGAEADSTGAFLIPAIPPGTINVRASSLGYAPETAAEIVISPGRTTALDFALDSAQISGKEVRIKGSYFKLPATQPTSQRSLRSEEIRRAPGAGEDVQRAIQALPGVVAQNDQNNEIVVRGGSPSENLIVVDGIEIDNINHFPDQSTSGGPINAINLEFVKEVSFVTGAFSAKYGDKLSSVLAVELRDGERIGSLGQAELSMAGAGLDYEHGFAQGRGSYLISYRKSYLDLIQKQVGLIAIPRYWDTQFRAAYDLSPTTKLSLYSLYTDDRIAYESENGDAWSRGAEGLSAKSHTFVIGARLKGVIGGGIGEATLARTSVHFDYRAYEMPERRNMYYNLSTDATDQLHLHWDKALSDGEFGVGASLKPIHFNYSQWFEPDTTVYDFNEDDIADTTVLSPPWWIERSKTSLKYASYVQYLRRFPHGLSLTLGLRLDGFTYSERYGLGPRLGLKWDVTGQTTLSFACGVHHQSQSMLLYLYDPTGANQRLPHSRATHYVLGISRLLDEATLISAEVYLKDYADLPVNEQSLRSDSDPLFRSWRTLAIGRKRATGLELFAQHKMAESWYGTASYSLGKATFDNSQKKYPANFDIRHIATLVVGYRTSLVKYTSFNDFQRAWYGWWSYALPLNGDEVTLSTRLRYVSGMPYTPQIWTDAGPELEYHWTDAGGVNSTRKPSYARWDLRWDSKWFSGSRAVVVFLEVQNVLNRGNIADYIYADDGAIDTVYQFRFFFVGGLRVNW